MNNKEMMDLFYQRRTYRRFFQEKPISDEIIIDMLTAARLSPSATNGQPLRYLVVKTPEMVEKVFPHTRWAAALPQELGTPKQGEHPTLFIVVLYDETQKTKWTDTDAGLAISSMTLAAMSHGVGNCIMDNVDRDQIRKELTISENMAIHSVIAFGYPSHSSTVVDMEEGDSNKYYLDEHRQYFVPKRKLDDIVSYI